MVRSTPSTAVTSPKDLCRSVSRTASKRSVRGASETEASRLLRGVAVLMAQDSPRVGCGPWPIGHYLLMTYLRGRRVVKYLGIPGESPCSDWGRASRRIEDFRHDASEVADRGVWAQSRSGRGGEDWPVLPLSWVAVSGVAMAHGHGCSSLTRPEVSRPTRPTAPGRTIACSATSPIASPPPSTSCAARVVSLRPTSTPRSPRSAAPSWRPTSPCPWCAPSPQRCARRRSTPPALRPSTRASRSSRSSTRSSSRSWEARPGRSTGPTAAPRSSCSPVSRALVRPPWPESSDAGCVTRASASCWWPPTSSAPTPSPS